MLTLAQDDQVQVKDPENPLDWRRAVVLNNASQTKDTTVRVVFRGSTVEHEIPWNDIKPLTPISVQSTVIPSKPQDVIVIASDDEHPDGQCNSSSLSDILPAQSAPLEDVPIPESPRQIHHSLINHNSALSRGTADDGPVLLQRSNDNFVYRNGPGHLDTRHGDPNCSHDDHFDIFRHSHGVPHNRRDFARHSNYNQSHVQNNNKFHNFRNPPSPGGDGHNRTAPNYASSSHLNDGGSFLGSPDWGQSRHTRYALQPYDRSHEDPYIDSDNIPHFSRSYIPGPSIRPRQNLNKTIYSADDSPGWLEQRRPGKFSGLNTYGNDRLSELQTRGGAFTTTTNSPQFTHPKANTPKRNSRNSELSFLKRPKSSVRSSFSKLAQASPIPNGRSWPQTQARDTNAVRNEVNAQPQSSGFGVGSSLPFKERHPNLWFHPNSADAPRVPRRLQSSQPSNQAVTKRLIGQDYDIDDSNDFNMPASHRRACFFKNQPDQGPSKKLRLSSEDISHEITDVRSGYGAATRSFVRDRNFALDYPASGKGIRAARRVLPKTDIAPTYKAKNPLKDDQVEEVDLEDVLADIASVDLTSLLEPTKPIRKNHYLEFPVRQRKRKTSICKKFPPKKKTDPDVVVVAGGTHEISDGEKVRGDHSRNNASRFSNKSSKKHLRVRKSRKEISSQDVPVYIESISLGRSSTVGTSVNSLRVHECLCGRINEPKAEVPGTCGSIQCSRCGLWSHIRCLLLVDQEIEEFRAHRQRFTCWHCVSVYPNCVSNDPDNSERMERGIQIRPVLPIGRAPIVSNHGWVQRKFKKYSFVRKPLEESECRARSENVEALRQGLVLPLVGKAEQAMIETLLWRKSRVKQLTAHEGKNFPLATKKSSCLGT